MKARKEMTGTSRHQKKVRYPKRISTVHKLLKNLVYINNTIKLIT